MKLGDSPGAAAFRSVVRTWLEENAVDSPKITTDLTPAQVAAWSVWSKRLFDAGFVGITWPPEYGGRGLSHAHQAVWLEESARAGVLDHLGLIGIGMAGPTIIQWGTDEQKHRFLPPILRCDEIWCQGFSEPSSGSDLASIRTRAVPDGDSWIVNGQKVWSSFADIADWCILLVRTDSSGSSHQGLSYLLLDLQSPGVEVSPLQQITGDAEFAEIFLTDVRVPRESMLGAPGDGWKVAMTTLSHERGTHGVGLAARLDADLRDAITRLREPLTADHRPSDDMWVRDSVAEIWIELQALKMTNQRSLSALAASGVPGPESTVAKLHWSELNQRLATLMTDVLGPEGLELGYDAPDRGRWPFARLRSRGNTIEAGTSEILRNLIAERVLNLPRLR